MPFFVSSYVISKSVIIVLLIATCILLREYRPMGRILWFQTKLEVQNQNVQGATSISRTKKKNSSGKDQSPNALDEWVQRTKGFFEIRESQGSLELDV
jgi:hypothetical protein